MTNPYDETQSSGGFWTNEPERRDVGPVDRLDMMEALWATVGP
jgi:hypothetical protein